MILTDRERVFLSECCATGAERKGRIWHAGSLTATRGEVGRLIRSGLLLRYGARLGVSAAGRRAVAKGKSPPVGVEIEARGHRRTLRGRVIASGPNEATLLPTDGGTLELTPRVGDDYHVPAVYAARRPHAGAPWKARIARLADYLDTPLWPALASLVPTIWTATLTTEPYTLARLREVNARLESIGAYARSAEEQAARAIARPFGIPLAGIRAMAERKYCSGDRARDDYLLEVIRRDPEPFDAADFAYACQEVKRAIFVDRPPGKIGPLEIRPLADIAKEHRYSSSRMLQRAYACLVPWAREMCDKSEARWAKHWKA